MPVRAKTFQYSRPAYRSPDGLTREQDQHGTDGVDAHSECVRLPALSGPKRV